MKGLRSAKKVFGKTITHMELEKDSFSCRWYTPKNELPIYLVYNRMSDNK